MGCVPRPVAREEITFVLFVYWEKNEGCVTGALICAPTGIWKHAASGRFWKVPVGIRRPRWRSRRFSIGPLYGPTDFRHSTGLKSHNRTRQIEKSDKS